MGIIPDVNRGAWTVIWITVAVLGMGFTLLISSTFSLNAEIARLDKTFQEMKLEHEKATLAANEALKARDEINALMREKRNELEKTLSGCPDFSGLSVPGSVCEQIRAACERQFQASGGAAHAD